MKKTAFRIMLALLLVDMLLLSFDEPSVSVRVAGVGLSDVSSLVEWMKAVCDNIDWRESTPDLGPSHYTKIWSGMMFGKNSTSDLESYIDSLGNSSSLWQQCLFLSAVASKLGVERQAAIQYALGNAPMTPYFPATTQSKFYTFDRYGLMGFQFAAEYGYLLDKWNVSRSFSEFNYTQNMIGDPLGWICSRGSYSCGSLRYYDEDSSTMYDYLMYDQLNVTGALDEAQHIWDWINSYCWSRDHYMYKPGSDLWECEAPFFFQDVALLKLHNSSIPYWNRTMIDLGNRFLSRKWNSVQWFDSTNSAYAVLHAGNGANTQRRLQNTLGAWFTLLGTAQLFNETYRSNMKDMLAGYTENGTTFDPAWKLLLTSGNSWLFDPSSFKFRMESSAAYTDYATSYGLGLLFFLGIVPGTGMPAIPLQDYCYEDVSVALDPGIYGLDFDTHSIKLALYNGTLGFQYGQTPVSCVFPTSGVYNVTFGDDWNSVVSVRRLSDLPSSRKWLKEAISPCIHDVAVTGVVPAEIKVVQGMPLNVSVTVENMGDFPEAFNVTAYSNASAFESQTASLESGNSTTIDFTWNTSSCVKGDYAISASASVVADERDTADNSLVANSFVTVLSNGRDLSIMSVQPSKTVVGQGCNLSVAVTARNFGVSDEAFETTIYVNTTAVQTWTLTLASGDKAILTFEWNATGFLRAYIMSASAAALPDEIDTTDNAFTYGVIKVSCIGDINGDYVTDAKDYQLVKKAIPSILNTPKWNPNADLNDDLMIDVRDYQIVKNHIPTRVP